VSSHTNRSVHAQKRGKLKATSVWHGTVFELGSIFTPGPVPENPPKCYAVENVQKNYLSLLFGERKVEMLFCLRAARLSSPGVNAGAFRRDLVRGGM
jgi:hypothetical protein